MDCYHQLVAKQLVHVVIYTGYHDMCMGAYTHRGILVFVYASKNAKYGQELTSVCK